MLKLRDGSILRQVDQQCFKNWIKRPTLSDLNQMQNRRRDVNFENGPHFICSLNLNNPESTVSVVLRMTDIASGDREIVDSLIGNNNEKINANLITFYRTFGGLGLLISKAQVGAYIAITNGCQQFNQARSEISFLKIKLYRFE